MTHLAVQDRAPAPQGGRQAAPLKLAVSNGAAGGDVERLGLVPAKTLVQRKRGGDVPALQAPHALSELLVDEVQDGAASAFAWALAQGSAAHGAASQRPLVVWVQDRMSAMEAGKPYLPGLGATMGHEGLAERFVLIEAKAGQDMLWAMEEVLLSGAASAVIGEIWGVPKALNFTATKRLQRSAQIGKTPCLLLRYGRERPASGAHERWHVTSQPSQPSGDDPAAPGRPRWHLDLFKARTRQPSAWRVEHQAAAQERGAGDDQDRHRTAHHLHLAAPLADGPVVKNLAAREGCDVRAHPGRAARPGGL